MLWLHYNHKMSTSFHKNRLISIHQPVGRRQIVFVGFVVRIIWRNYSWLSPTYLSLCQDGIHGWNHFT